MNKVIGNLNGGSAFKWIYHDSKKKNPPLSTRHVYRGMEVLGLGNLLKWILNVTGGTIKLSWTWAFGNTFSKPNEDQNEPKNMDDRGISGRETSDVDLSIRGAGNSDKNRLKGDNND